MVNLLFCAAALALFTVGFRLVKLGNPFKRGGGDSYTRRRMYRMLGWGMWTTAGVLVSLSLIDSLYTGAPTVVDMGIATGVAKPDAEQVQTVKFTTQLIPNLLHAPTLQANTSGTNTAPVSASGLSFSSIQAHPESIVPTMMQPLHDDLPSDDRELNDPTRNPGIRPPAAAASAPAPREPTPSALPSPTDIAAAPGGQKALGATLELALTDANQMLRRDPENIPALLQRGNVYAALKRWDLAQADFQAALHIDSSCVPAAFALAELNFQQGHYEAARPGFLALVRDPDRGDLASYKVFLCDLFGGREEVAAKELAVFNQSGSDASYYFANVAWSLFHKKADDAKTWWDSANGIFAPDKVNLYAKPLIDLGYIKITS